MGKVVFFGDGARLERLFREAGQGCPGTATRDPLEVFRGDRQSMPSYSYVGVTCFSISGEGSQIEL